MKKKYEGLEAIKVEFDFDDIVMASQKCHPGSTGTFKKHPGTCKEA